MTRGTLAVTGGSGFIGAAVVRRLASEGWRIRALYRSDSPRLFRLPGSDAVSWLRGSLSDGESLVTLVQSVQAVVHCAGAVRGASAASFNQVNVDGVARLVQATRQLHPRPRFLLMSSLAAREPGLSDYAASKRRGEETLSRLAGGMPWVGLRPPAVYGPGDREMLPLLRWMQRGLAPRIGSEHARFSLIFVEDLAAAVARVLQRPAGPPGPFELHDGQPGGYRWPDVLAVAARVFGRRIRTVRVPPPVLKAVAAANRRLARWIGYAPMLTPGKVRELTHPDWVCDNTAFSRSTGWAPAVALAKGLEMTMAAGGLQAGRERKG